MAESESSSHPHRPIRRGWKILWLVGYFAFLLALPVLPAVFPNSRLVQFCLGNSRFLLVWLLMSLLFFPDRKSVV